MAKIEVTLERALEEFTYEFAHNKPRILSVGSQRIAILTEVEYQRIDDKVNQLVAILGW